MFHKSGIEQCNLLKKKITFPISLVLCSCMKRTIQTATLVFPNYNLIAVDYIRESFCSNDPTANRSNIKDLKSAFPTGFLKDSSFFLNYVGS